MKLTIGVPIYNAERYIENALTSIMNQTLKDWICVIIDDGSVDGSIEIVKKLIKNDHRFKLIVDEQNIGLSSRLNQIASLSETKYLARMDADDIMTYDRLAVQLEHLESDESIDVVGSAAYIIDVDNRVRAIRSGQTNFDVWTALRGNLFIHPTVMGKTQWFQNNPYNTHRKRSEDYDLWSRTASSSKFSQIDRPLLFYREFGLEHANKYDASMSEILEILSERSVDYDEVFRRHASKIMADIKWKRAVFRVISLVGMEKFLLNMRSKNLQGVQQREAELALRLVLQSIPPIEDATVLHGGNK
jgi:glycosyltransferase involved in cell wall biosynthesis